jgi:hypothetical protein
MNCTFAQANVVSRAVLHGIVRAPFRRGEGVRRVATDSFFGKLPEDCRLAHKAAPLDRVQGHAFSDRLYCTVMPPVMPFQS